MPKQIDLEPHEYRRRGVARIIPNPLDGPAYSIWGVACGIWAGVVIGICRYFVEGENLWLVVALSLGPIAVWGIALLLADKPR